MLIIKAFSTSFLVSSFLFFIIAFITFFPDFGLKFNQRGPSPSNAVVQTHLLRRNQPPPVIQGGTVPCSVNKPKIACTRFPKELQTFILITQPETRGLQTWALGLTRLPYTSLYKESCSGSSHGQSRDLGIKLQKCQTLNNGTVLTFNLRDVRGESHSAVDAGPYTQAVSD